MYLLTNFYVIYLTKFSHTHWNSQVIRHVSANTLLEYHSSSFPDYKLQHSPPHHHHHSNEKSWGRWSPRRQHPGCFVGQQRWCVWASVSVCVMSGLPGQLMEWARAWAIMYKEWEHLRPSPPFLSLSLSLLFLPSLPSSRPEHASQRHFNGSDANRAERERV